MDSQLADSLRVLKTFFDDIHKKRPPISVDHTLISLSLDHVRCFCSGLRLFQDYEDQPYDSESITNSEQSKFLYDLRCLHNYALQLRHLKIVPRQPANVENKHSIDVSEFSGLKTLEVKNISYVIFRGLDVLCTSLESVVCTKCSFPSIEAALLSLKRTRSKKHNRGDRSLTPAWNNLKILKLPSNKIRVIDSSLSLAKNLEVLDLSFNRIKSSDLSLECLPKLECLLLNYNSLSSLANVVSPVMTKLTQLSLSFNLLQSVEGVEELVNLKELDVSYNLIAFLDNVNKLKPLKKLEKLVMEGNPVCLDKNYRAGLILKLHQAVVSQISVDGTKLSKNEKKLYFATLDSPANPLPETLHDVATESVVVTRTNKKKKKPRIISEIPDQTNFQDEDDFLLSGSFKEKNDLGGCSTLVDDILDRYQPKKETEAPVRSHGNDDRGPKPDPAAEMSPDVVHSLEDRPRPAGDSAGCSRDRVEEGEEGFRKLKVEVVVEKCVAKNEMAKLEVPVDISNEESSTEDFKSLHNSQETIPSLYKDMSSTTTFSSTLDSSAVADMTGEYFDVTSPSIDNSISLIVRSRPSVSGHDIQASSQTLVPPKQLSPDSFSSVPDFPLFAKPFVDSEDIVWGHGTEVTTVSEGGEAGLHSGEAMARHRTSTPNRPVGIYFKDDDDDDDDVDGYEKESQSGIKDLSHQKRKFIVQVISSSSTPQQPMVCVVVDHWLVFVRKEALPKVKVVEEFDLQALVKVEWFKKGLKSSAKKTQPQRAVRLEFDTVLKQRRERIVLVENGAEEFVQVLEQFLEEKKMVQCLKCGHLFEDEDQGTDMPSTKLGLKAKKALAAQKQEQQKCPKCRSTMIIQAPSKPRNPDVGESAKGLTSFFAKPDLSSVANFINRSLTSEMGIIDLSTSAPSQLTLSGSYLGRGSPIAASAAAEHGKKTVKYIDRGMIGRDEDVKFYVDEEAQEAM